MISYWSVKNVRIHAKIKKKTIIKNNTHKIISGINRNYQSKKYSLYKNLVFTFKSITEIFL